MTEDKDALTEVLTVRVSNNEIEKVDKSRQKLGKKTGIDISRSAYIRKLIKENPGK